MRKFLVTYDLHEGQNYGPLEKHLASYDSWWHALESVWIIAANGTAIAVCNALRVHAPADAKILVIDISSDSAAWLGFDEEASNWLEEQL